MRRIERFEKLLREGKEREAAGYLSSMRIHLTPEFLAHVFVKMYRRINKLEKRGK